MKIPYLDSWNKERRVIAGRYNREISNDKLTLPKWDGLMDHVFHIYPVLCENRDRLTAYLGEKGIATNIHYPTPIYKQGAYWEFEAEQNSYPVTSKICREEVSIPLYPGLKKEEQDYIITCLNEYAG